MEAMDSDLEVEAMAAVTVVAGWAEAMEEVAKEKEVTKETEPSVQM